MKLNLATRKVHVATLFAFASFALSSCAQSTSIDARTSLLAIVNSPSESNGAVVVRRFAQIAEKTGKEEGRTFAVIEYKAEIEFRKTGVWSFGPDLVKRSLILGRTVEPSFRVIAPPDFSNSGGGRLARMNAENKWNDENPGTAVKAGDRVTIRGEFTYSRDGTRWTVARHVFDVSQEANPWVLAKDENASAAPTPAAPPPVAVSASEPLTAAQRAAIITNLRNFTMMGSIVMLQTKKQQATYDDMVGPDKLLKSVPSIAGEDYRGIKVELGKSLTVTTASGEKVGEYDDPGASPPAASVAAIAGQQSPLTESQRRAIQNNLRQFASAADQVMLREGKTVVTFDDLVGPTKLLTSAGNVAGEDYRTLKIEMGKALTVTAASGEKVSIEH
jgi:hypothetical protein